MVKRTSGFHRSRFPAAVLAVVMSIAAAAASADVTIRQTTDGKALGMNGVSNSVTYIKGARMRVETEFGGKTRVSIFDLDQQKLFAFEPGKKDVDAWDMASLSAEVGKSVNAGAMTSSFKPNGQKRDVGGKSATGYAIQIAIPVTIGGEGGLRSTVRNTGTVWVVKGAPGTADYVNFYRQAAEKGWIFSDPRVAKGQPGQARAMAVMQRPLAAAGGLPYETDMAIQIEGEGPLAAMASMGNSTFKTVVQSVDTADLADELFAPPAGAKLKSKK